MTTLRVGFLLGWLIAVLAVGIAGYSYFVQVRTTVLQNLVDQIDSQIVQTSITVAALMDGLKGAVLSSAAHTAQLHRDGNDGLLRYERAFNDSVKMRLRNLRTILTTDRNGVIRNDAREDRPAVGIDVSDRQYFIAHRDPRPEDLYVSDPVVSRVDRRLTWVLSAASRDDAGDLVAVTVASVDRGYFSGAMAWASRIPGVTIALRHDNGTILEDSSGDGDMIGTALADAVAAAGKTPFDTHPVLGANTGFQHDRPDEGPPLDGWPLTIEALLDDAAIAEALLPHRQNAVVLTAGLIVLLTLITYFAYRAVVNQVAARAAAEHASQVKSQFLASMSHEFRTPLNAIIGFSETMGHETFGPMGDKYKEYASAIQKSGAHLVDLVDDLLDLSKIESGEYDLDEQVLDIGDLLRETIALRPQASVAERRPRVTLDAAAASVHLRCDRRAFVQILDNLVSNALKFSGPDGRIEVSWSRTDAGAVELRVADDGPGIDPGEIPSLLSPFVQGTQPADGNPYVARKKSGVGLGLSIVDQLVKLHQAELDIDSTLGNGTRVTVRFPKDRVVVR